MISPSLFRSFMPDMELKTLEERFMAAVYDGDDVEAMELLSDERLDINGKISRAVHLNPDLNFTTAMHIAISKGRTSIARLILEHPDYQIARTDINNHTALHYAALYDISGALAKKLLAHRGAEAIVNLRDIQGDTALHLSCDNSNVVTLRELLKVAQIETSPLSVDLTTPMMLAAKNSDVSSLEALLEHGVDCNIGLPQLYPGYRPLHSAVAFNNASSLEMLLNNGAATTKTATLDLILNDEPISQMEPTHFERPNMVSCYINLHMLDRRLSEMDIRTGEKLLEASPQQADDDLLFELYNFWFHGNLAVNAATRDKQKKILCRIIYKSLGRSVDDRLQGYLMNRFKLTENEDFRLLIPYRSRSLKLFCSIIVREDLLRIFEAGNVTHAFRLGREKLKTFVGLFSRNTLHLDWRIYHYINEITSKGFDFYSIF